MKGEQRPSKSFLRTLRVRFKTQQHFAQSNAMFSCRTSSLGVRCAGLPWVYAHFLCWQHRCFISSLAGRKKCDALLNEGYIYQTLGRNGFVPHSSLGTMALKKFESLLTFTWAIPRPISMCCPSLLRTHACQADWSTLLLSARFHTLLLAIPPRRELARMPVFHTPFVSSH